MDTTRKVSITLMLLLFGAMGCSLTDSGSGEGGINQPDVPVYPQPYGRPWVSTDGNKMLFVRNSVSHIRRSGGYTFKPDSSGIWLADLDGGGMKLILSGFNLDFPSLSSDGQWLLFGAGAQIYKAPFAGDSIDIAGIVQLTTEGRNFFPAWSPDGQWIAYDNTSCGNSTDPPPPTSCGVLRMRNDGTDKQLLLDWARLPAWHPNGQSLIAVIGTSATIVWTQFIRYYPFDNRTSDTLDAAVDNENLYPKYSPDGSKIVFQSHLRVPNGGVQVLVMDSAGRNLTQLTTDGGFEPAWAPNGRIIYVRYDPHRYDEDNGTLWVMAQNGSGKRQLTFNHGLQLQD